MQKSFLKNLSKDTLLYIPAQIIPGIISFISLMIYTRLLTPEEYGRYTLVYTVTMFITTMFFSWIEQSTVRFYKEMETEKSKILITTITITALSLVILISIIYILIVNIYIKNYISDKVLFLLNTSVFLLSFMVFYKISLQFLRANRQAGFYSVYSCLFKFISVALSVIFIYFFSYAEVSIILGMGFAYLFVFVLQARKLLPFIKLKFFSLDIIIQLFKYGSPWVGITIGSYLLSRFDRYVIDLYLTTDKVGIYSATYSLAEKGIMQVASLLSISSFPLLIENFNKGNEEKASLIMKDLLKIYSIFFIPAVFGLSYFSKDIISIFLGEQFQGANLVFIVISIGALFEALRNLSGRPFQLKRITHYLPLLLIISGLINVFLNFLLVPKYELLGAAFATLIGYAFYFAISFFISKRFFKWIIPYKTMYKSFFASCIMVMGIYFFSVNLEYSIISLIYNLLIGIIFYFLSMIMLKEEIIIKTIESIRKDKKYGKDKK